MIGTPVCLTGNPSFVVASAQLTPATRSRILELIAEANPAEPVTANTGARIQARLPDTLIRRIVGILVIAIAARYLWSGLS
jgi:uncharacterized membrane protein YfcA